MIIDSSIPVGVPLVGTRNTVDNQTVGVPLCGYPEFEEQLKEETRLNALIAENLEKVKVNG